MISHYFRNDETEALQTLDEACHGVWTHVVSPTDEELRSLIEQYSFDDVIIENSRDVFETPRFERDGAISYFFARYLFDVKDIDIDTAPILFILGEGFLVTIANRPVPFLEPFLAEKRLFSTVENTSLFLQCMSELVMTYEKKLTRTRKVVYRDVGRIRDIRVNDIQRLVFLEQELSEILSGLVPMQEWFRQLSKNTAIKMDEEDTEMLEYLLIDNSQLIDSAKSILKTIQNIRNASESILTQNLNVTIRRLTAFTIVLNIPTLVFSMFGMNIPIPFQESRHASFYVSIIVLALMLSIVYLFKRNKWI